MSTPISPTGEPLLRLEDLRTHFRMEAGIAKAVDGVNYEIWPGKTLSVVGESGCGKSVTALSIMGLIATPPGIKAGGKILFKGTDLLTISEEKLRRLRGNDIAMIFQEPMTSLNPVYTVGDQIGEALRLHKGMTRKEAREYSIEMLRRVGIPRPDARVDDYPHQMSGGMRQRVMIAMALSCDPVLLIADEPTTALDVTIQAQILDLMAKLQDDFGTSVLFITHDLGVVAEVSDHVAVMYAGKVVEHADVFTLYENARHPYTVGLFKSLPDLSSRRGKLEVIPGIVPSPLDFPTGCRFRNRCPLADARCAAEEPLLRDIGSGAPTASRHTVACHAVEEGRDRGLQRGPVPDPGDLTDPRFDPNDLTDPGTPDATDPGIAHPEATDPGRPSLPAGIAQTEDLSGEVPDIDDFGDGDDEGPTVMIHVSRVKALSQIRKLGGPSDAGGSGPDDGDAQ